MSENTTKATWVLPDDVATMLRDAYSAYRDALSARASSSEKREALKKLASIAKAGRDKGWPYSELSKPCKMTAERLRQVVAEFEKVPSNREARALFPKFKSRPTERKDPAPRRRKTKRSTLTEAEKRHLQELAPLARQNSGSTALNSPIRKASEEFSKLIIKYHKRGVVWQELAEASGHTFSGVRMRASRHNYGSGPPPSIPAYRRTTIYEQQKIRKRQEAKDEKQKQREAKQNPDKAPAT